MVTSSIRPLKIGDYVYAKTDEGDVIAGRLKLRLYPPGAQPWPDAERWFVDKEADPDPSIEACWCDTSMRVRKTG